MTLTKEMFSEYIRGFNFKGLFNYLGWDNTKISLPLKATGTWVHRAAREDLPVTLLNRSETTSSGNIVPLLTIFSAIS